MRIKVIKTFKGFLLLSFYALAQNTVIKNAEDFRIGTTLIFQEAKDDSTNITLEGNKYIWDYSKIKILHSKTNTQRIVPPDSTPFYDLFPNANLVEHNSDGSYVYILKKGNENHLVGFVGAKNNEITIKYGNPMLFIKRPIKLGDSISDEFTTEYSVREMNFKGKGIITLKADGYGKLLLPQKTYDTVLRLVIKQVQYDTLLQYSTVTKTETINYLWFDNEHTSALLKITEIKSDFYKNKRVQYLLREE